MHPEIRTTIAAFDFDTVLVRLGLEDVDRQQATLRLPGGFVSIAWLAGHLLAGRHNVGRLAGLDLADPWKEQFGTDSECTDGRDYPAIETMATAWSELAGPLRARLVELDGEALAAESSAGPATDQTVRGALAFWTWHETYHVGQLGLIRARMGLPTLRDLFYEHRQQAASAAPS